MEDFYMILFVFDNWNMRYIIFFIFYGEYVFFLRVYKIVIKIYYILSYDDNFNDLIIEYF